MEFYCGIDLHAKSSQVCVIDGEGEVHVNQKVPNRLRGLLSILEPFEPKPQVVVESTFNWYWLIDGLQDAGFEVTLAHTLGLYMITKAKVKTDRRDARTLANLLRIDAVPKAYIYPKETRPVRDLVRVRTQVVRLRSAEYTCLRKLFYQLGLSEHTRKEVLELEEGDIEKLIRDPEMKLPAQQRLERISLYNAQIWELEKLIVKAAKQQPGYLRLLELPGFGKVLAAITFYEIGDIGRFRTAKNFSSYCRVVPGVASSSGKSGRGRGSKQGNPNLKSAFSQAAVHAVRRHERIRRYFNRQLRRRSAARRLVAYNIVAHKLAVAVFHVLKEKKPYKEQLLFGN